MAATFLLAEVNPDPSADLGRRPHGAQPTQILVGSVLTNGDTFDFRSGLAATNRGGNSGDLSDYLQVGMRSDGNTGVSVSATAGGPANLVLVLDGVTASMSDILAHSIT